MRRVFPTQRATPFRLINAYRTHLQIDFMIPFELRPQALFAILICLAISVAGGLVYPALGLTSGFLFLGCAVLAALAVAIDGRIKISHLALAIALAGAGVLMAAHSWYGVYVKLQANQSPFNRQLIGWIGQPNQYGSFLLMAIVSIAYLWTRLRHTLVRGVLVLCAIAVILPIPLTNSRTALINSALLLALGVWIVLGQVFRARRDYYGAGVWLIALGALLMGLQLVEPKVMSALSGEHVAGLQDRIQDKGFTAGSKLRTDEWRKSVLMLKAHPLGVGVGQYGAASFMYQTQKPFSDTPKDRIYAHSHNMFTQFAAELGWPGLCILFGFWCVWLWQQFRQPLTYECIFCWSVVLVLFVHSNAEFPLWYWYFLVPMVWALALTEAPLLTLRLHPVAAWVGGFLLAFFLCFMAWEWGASAYLLNQGQIERSRRHPALAKAYAISALRHWGEDGEAEKLLAYIEDDEPGNLPRKMARNRRLLAWRPFASVVYRQAILEAQVGNLAAAKQWLVRGLTVYSSQNNRRDFFESTYSNTPPNAELKALCAYYHLQLKVMTPTKVALHQPPLTSNLVCPR